MLTEFLAHPSAHLAHPRRSGLPSVRMLQQQLRAWCACAALLFLSGAGVAATCPDGQTPTVDTHVSYVFYPKSNTICSTPNKLGTAPLNTCIIDPQGGSWLVFACTVNGTINLTSYTSGLGYCRPGAEIFKNGTLSDNTCQRGALVNFKFSCVQVPTCTPCSPGSAGTGGSCTACAVGTYQSSASQPSCLACSVGTYQNAMGQTACVTCPDQTFSNSGATTCATCTANQVVNSAGACVACSTGTVPNLTRTACNGCQAGYQPNPDSTACVVCPANTFSAANALTCTPCPYDSIAATGSSSCNFPTCRDGEQRLGPQPCSFCPSGSAGTGGVCQPCAAGSVPNSNSTACATCGANSFASAGASVCAQCAIGTYGPRGGTSGTACIQCPAGWLQQCYHA